MLDKLNNPKATTIREIANAAIDDDTGLPSEFGAWLKDRKNRRVIPYRLEKCDYVPVRNDAAKDGLWKINGARQAVYARSDLSVREQLKAAHSLTA